MRGLRSELDSRLLLVGLPPLESGLDQHRYLHEFVLLCECPEYQHLPCDCGRLHPRAGPASADASHPSPTIAHSRPLSAIQHLCEVLEVCFRVKFLQFQQKPTKRRLPDQLGAASSLAHLRGALSRCAVRETCDLALNTIAQLKSNKQRKKKRKA